MTTKNVSSSVKNAYQAVVNRVLVLTKEGKTKDEVVAEARKQMHRQSELATISYNKADLIDKEKFEFYVEEEYVRQTMTKSIRDTLKEIL